MTVRVTKSEIRAGAPGACPIDLALVRHGVDGIVGLDFVSFFAAGSVLVTLPLPASAVAFIADFDDNRAVEPFEFELEIPEAALS